VVSSKALFREALEAVLLGGRDSEPQRYTVHFDGIDYQDLTRDYHGLSRSRAEYKTKAGKRIEFHGNFYEVEQ
jgi:hypothetical protein